MTRLFVGVRPPEDIVVALERLPRLDGPGVRWVPPAHWHITLRFLGRADPLEVGAVLAGAALPSCEVELGPRVSRLGRGVVVVPAHGLQRLAEVVGSVTSELGDPPDPRGLRSHLTLARLKGRAACGVTGAPVSLRWSVGEVELVSSVTDPAGAIHEVLTRFPTV